MNKNDFDRTRLPSPRDYYSKQFTNLDTSKKQVNVICPFHDDHNPSLSINLDTGCFNCFSCEAKGGDVLDFQIKHYNQDFKTAACTLGAWREDDKMMTTENIQKTSLKQSIISNDKAKEMILKTPTIKNLLRQGYTDTEFYPYTDRDGKPILWRVRLESTKDGKKEFRPFHLKNDNMTLGEPPEIKNSKHSKPLYNLPAVVNSDIEDTIFFVEGEKCVNCLSNLGIVCTTSGAWSTAEKADLTHVAKRHVVLWRDNDEQGKKWEKILIRRLNDLGCNVEGIDIEKLGLQEKGDCVDWLESNPNVTKNNILGLSRITLHLDSNNKKLKSSIKVLTLQELLNANIPLREYILTPFMTTQSLTMIHAPTGFGKTHVALGIACAVAFGTEFFNWKSSKTRGVLFIDGEMALIDLQERVKKIVSNSEAELSVKETNLLKFVTPDTQENSLPDLATEHGQQAINELIDDTIELIIIDNLSCLILTGKENESESWTPIQSWLLQLRRKGKSVVLIHHSGKSGEQRGTSKRGDVLNNTITLKRPFDYKQSDGARFEVHFEKSRNNYGNDCLPFEAKLINDESKSNGKSQYWKIINIEESTHTKVISLAQEGLTNIEISKELGFNRGTIFKHLKRAENEGKICKKPATKKKEKKLVKTRGE